MNYFLCGLDTIQLGIPAEWTERIIPVTRVQTALYETEGQETYISLPVLFRQKDCNVPHGVVLKDEAVMNSSLADDGSSAGAGSSVDAGGIVKTVLLTPRIEKDLEIPEENIHGLPEALNGLLRYFKGACFNGNSMILILNSKKITENIR